MFQRPSPAVVRSWSKSIALASAGANCTAFRHRDFECRRTSWATSSSHTNDGRRVAVNPLAACGTCDLCEAGKTNLCRTRSLLGIHVAGGFAERVSVPLSSVHDLPDELEWDRAALIEPVANAVHAWVLAGSPQGRRVGVIGCGPIGLACLEIARYRGAALVACAERSGERRDVALTIGADEVAEALDGEFDVIFDAVGTLDTRRASLEHLIPGGTTVWLGLATSDPGFDAAHAVRTEKNVRGSFAYTDEQFADAVAIALRLNLSSSTTYPLNQGAEVFNALMAGQATPIKALLRP